MEIILYTQYFSIKFVYVFERNIFHFDANALNLISIRKKKKIRHRVFPLSFFSSSSSFS